MPVIQTATAGIVAIPLDFNGVPVAEETPPVAPLVHAAGGLAPGLFVLKKVTNICSRSY